MQPMKHAPRVRLHVVVFLLVVVAVPCNGALRKGNQKTVETTTRRDNPFGDVLDTVKDSAKDVTDAVSDTAEAAGDVVDKTSGGATKDMGEVIPQTIPGILLKPVMNQINVMRAEMCWARPDLMNHGPCMKFLGLHCKEGRTGVGICKKFKKNCQEKCQSESDADKKKSYCDLAKSLENADKKYGAKGEPGKDTDGDGIPDDKDPDIDNDGHKNEDDAFPLDSKEWNDLDGDGIGDNSDPDRDGDGHNNDKDGFPDDPSKHLGCEGDEDGDGVKNCEDAFPEDPKEWGDIDKDGIGDNADTDKDGDGHDNEKDEFPENPNRHTDDSDGDGIPDEEDAFPKDASEWSDRDGDGHGDNSDAYPDSKHCWEPDEPCDQEVDLEDSAWANSINKLEKQLPPQGYNEYGQGKLVEHDDKETFTGDWQSEWPARKETESESIGRICKENPQNVWCKRYATHGHFAR